LTPERLLILYRRLNLDNQSNRDNPLILDSKLKLVFLYNLDNLLSTEPLWNLYNSLTLASLSIL
jgi:hypothetical protein